MPSGPDDNSPVAQHTPELRYCAGILVTDTKAAVHSCNAEFLHLTGYSRQELINSSMFDLLEPNGHGQRQEILSAIEHEGCCTIRLKARQGALLSLSLTCCDLPACSTDRRVIMSLYDIRREESLRHSYAASQKTLEKTLAAHDRKLHEYTASLIETNVDLRRKVRDHQLAAEALKESEARFRDLTETTSDFIWEIDQNARYTYASPKIVKLLGYTPEELLGQQSLMLRNPEMAARFIREIELGPDPEAGFSSWHYSYTHKDGREVFIESSGEPIIMRKNEISGYRGIDRDITDRVYYEKNLRMAKELAESANRAKSEFLANMSHELRTPLHAILSFSKFGEKKIDTAGSAELLKYFKQIETSAQRLLPLINSLLDLSKLEAGKMNYDIVHGAILEEILIAVDEMNPLAVQKEIRIVLNRRHAETDVYFDRNKIAQVIRNILSNAIKFCEPRSTISISFALSTDRKKRKYLRTSIANTGIGVPENELETIFDKFAQSSKTKTGAGGTGLGLAICRQILIDLRGRIWAENGNNNLTLFHFTLPTFPKSEKLGNILMKRGLVSREDLEKALLDQ